MTDLQYNECTWETYEEIRQGAQEAIDAFHERQARNTVPARSVPYGINNRPAYSPCKDDPDYIKVGGELKPFQLVGLNWLSYIWSKGENGVLADEVSRTMLNENWELIIRWVWERLSNR
jgi:chromodomain-helicase-DNA-binding protein 1